MDRLLRLVLCLTASLLAVRGQTECNNTTDTVRLVQAGDELQVGAGRVELCRNGYWGTVCSQKAQWGLKNAQVVCREVGYQYAVTAIPLESLTVDVQAPVGVLIHLTDVQCNGAETSILDCVHSDDTSQCSHLNDAVIVCGVTAITGDIRLEGDTENYRGAVLYYNSRVGWTGVCTDPDHASTWTNRAAELVCTQLGFEGGRAFSQRSDYIDQLVFADFECDSNDASLNDCERSSLIFSGGCTTKDAGWVECQPTDAEDYSVRLLPGSREGLVEVAYNGRWGQVCGDVLWQSAPTANARTVCNQLGLESESAPSIINENTYIQYESNVKPYWLSDVVCNTATDNTLEDCGAIDRDLIGYSVGCSPVTSTFNSAGVNCGPPVPFRLSGGAVAGIVIASLLVMGLAIFLFIKGPEIWKKRHSYGWYRKLTTPSDWCRSLRRWFGGCCGSLCVWFKSHTPRQRERTRRRPQPVLEIPTTATPAETASTTTPAGETREYPPATYPSRSSSTSSSEEERSLPPRVPEPQIGFIVQGDEEQGGGGGNLTAAAPPTYQAAVSYPVATGPSQPPAYTEKAGPYPPPVGDPAYPPATGASLPYPSSDQSNPAYPPTVPDLPPNNS